MIALAASYRLLSLLADVPPDDDGQGIGVVVAIAVVAVILVLVVAGVVRRRRPRD